MGDLDSNISLGSSVSSKTKVFHLQPFAINPTNNSINTTNNHAF